MCSGVTLRQQSWAGEWTHSWAEVPHVTAQRTGAGESAHKACDTPLWALCGTKSQPTTLFLILYSYLSTNGCSISSVLLVVHWIRLHKHHSEDCIPKGAPPQESCPQTSPPILCKCSVLCKQNYCCAARMAATESEKAGPYLMDLQGRFSDYDYKGEGITLEFC